MQQQPVQSAGWHIAHMILCRVRQIQLCSNAVERADAAFTGPWPYTGFIQHQSLWLRVLVARGALQCRAHTALQTSSQHNRGTIHMPMTSELITHLVPHKCEGTTVPQQICGSFTDKRRHAASTLVYDGV